MRNKKLIVLLAIFAVLTLGLVACTPAEGLIPEREENGGETPAPENGGEAPAPENGDAEEPKASSDADIEQLLEVAKPKIEDKVSSGEISPESGQLMIEGIKDGTYKFENIQAMMMGMEPFPTP